MRSEMAIRIPSNNRRHRALRSRRCRDDRAMFYFTLRARRHFMYALSRARRRQPAELIGHGLLNARLSADRWLSVVTKRQMAVNLP